MSLGINVLEVWKKMASYPGGKALFSYIFASKAPYFMTIRPRILEIEAGKASVKMNQSWIVQNHIKTVHAIAVCNLVEMTMGLVAEVSIPSHLRWLPMGMDIEYLKKATGTLTAKSDIDPAKFFELPTYPGILFLFGVAFALL